MPISVDRSGEMTTAPPFFLLIYVATNISHVNNIDSDTFSTAAALISPRPVYVRPIIGDVCSLDIVCLNPQYIFPGHTDHTTLGGFKVRLPCSRPCVFLS